MCICCTRSQNPPSGASVTRTHVYVRTPPSITRGSSGEQVGRAEGGGLRLPDAQSHLALTVKDGAGRRGALSRGQRESITGTGEGGLKWMRLICRRPRHRQTGFRLAADGVTELTPPGRFLPSDIAGVGAACSRF